MMQRLFLILLVLAISFGTAQASLVDNGGGLIYDTDQNITWYDATSTLVDRYHRVLDQNQQTGAVAGWRLPDLPIPARQYYPSLDTTDGEMEYLYYIELGNKAGGPLTNTGPFLNRPTFLAWPDSDIWNNCGEGKCVAKGVFGFANRTTDYLLDPNVPVYGDAYLPLVHDSNVVSTPIPGAVWLFGSGLAALAGLRRKFSS